MGNRKTEKTCNLLLLLLLLFFLGDYGDYITVRGFIHSVFLVILHSSSICCCCFLDKNVQLYDSERKASFLWSEVLFFAKTLFVCLFVYLGNNHEQNSYDKYRYLLMITRPGTCTGRTVGYGSLISLQFVLHLFCFVCFFCVLCIRKY